MTRLEVYTLVFTLSACPADRAAGGKADATTTTTGDAGTTLVETPGSTLDPSGTSTSGESTTSTGGESGMLPLPDIGNPPCDLWKQDCPEGFKCQPVDYVPVDPEVRCVPIPSDPAQAGEPCQPDYEGFTDDCDFGLVCIPNSVFDENGTCFEQCTGSEDDPLCPSADQLCTLTYAPFVVCADACDPLLQGCKNGGPCAFAGDDGFVCLVPRDKPGSYGDTCFLTLDCSPGLHCSDAAGHVPGCVDQCCTLYCDLTDPDPDATCPDVGLGQSCIAFFPDPPPQYEHVGFCGFA